MRWGLLQKSKQRHFMCKTCSNRVFCFVFTSTLASEHCKNERGAFSFVCFCVPMQCSLAMFCDLMPFGCWVFLCLSLSSTCGHRTLMFTFNSTFLHALCDFAPQKMSARAFGFFRYYMVLLFFFSRVNVCFYVNAGFIEREYVKQLNKNIYLDGLGLCAKGELLLCFARFSIRMHAAMKHSTHNRLFNINVRVDYEWHF